MKPLSKNNIYEKPIFPQRGIFNSIDMICCCTNSAIGLGALNLGAIFTSGLITAFLLLFIICFLSFYSYKLFLLSAATCHQSTYEEIWESGFSKKTVFIPVFFSVISTLLNMITYIREIQLSAIAIFTRIILFFSSEPDQITFDLEKYKILIGCAVFIFFLIPVCLMKKLRTMAFISYVSIFFFGLFIIYLIIMFAYLVKTEGFDPDHSFKLFHLNDRFAKSLSTSLFAFNFYPLTYPGIRHVKNSTSSNILKIFGITLIIILINYIVVGLFSYLTFFDKNMNGTVLDHFPENTKFEKILIVIGRIVSFVFILFTLPFRLNACRYVILNTINDSSSFPADIWCFLGIIISLLALVLGNLSDKYLNILFIFSDVMASFLLFIFSPLFYLKINGTSDRFHTVISILFLFIGVATTVFMIFYDGFY